MKILLIHNKYEIPGGEDLVVETEGALLASAGHEVHQFIVSNTELKTFADKALTAWWLPWNPGGFSRASEIIRRIKPDIINVHNFFAMLSPSIYDAAIEANIPIVQTLHNFRIICANGLLLRAGKPCEVCITRSPYNAVRYRCYRNSIFASASLARMIAIHKRKRTWQTKPSRFFVLSNFARTIFEAAGIPRDKISVKPNCVRDHGWRGDALGDGVLYVGRLSNEKGAQFLIEAARSTNVPIRIVGDGPLRVSLERKAPQNVEFVGHLSQSEVLTHMRRARCLVIPSICYENFPLALIEAFAVGLPVIASGLGALQELVEHEATGLLTVPGNPCSIAGAIERLTNDAVLCRNISRAARRKYDDNYSPNQVLSILDAEYRLLIS